jgi:hypothetical protein
MPEEKSYSKANMASITKKVKEERSKKDTSTPLNSKDNTSSLGV